MSKKKRKIPKKQRGVRYVAKVIKKYGGKKYKNYQLRLEKSREVLSELKKSGDKVKVSTVMNLTRVHRKAPFISPELLEKREYYYLIDYDAFIHVSSDQITFKSDLYNAGVDEIQGRQRPAYEKTFSAFVNFANKETPPGTSSEDIKIFVQTTPPKFIKGKWTSFIISVSPDGEPYDFGYVPTEAPTQLPKREKPIKPTKKSEKEEFVKSDRTKALELELKLSKEKSRQQATELFLKGLINKKEYKDEIDRINKL